MEKISVIIPAYNAEKTIQRCIESIEVAGKCDLFDFELIVVNDGSTDNTLQIVETLQATYKNINVISQENKGPAGSRETGLRNATGDYIAHCDSDDWVTPEWLSHLYNNIKKYDADISVCRAIIDNKFIKYNPQEIELWNRDEAIGEFIIHKKLNGCLWNKLIRRELFDGISFSPEMWYWEDLYVVWKVLQRVNKVVRCNEGTYHYVIHPESICAQPINENRLYCTLKVWDMIVADCLNYYPHHLNAAQVMREKSLLGGLKQMVRSNFKHEEYEEKILNILHDGGLKNIVKMDSFIDKFFAIAMMICPKCVRKLYNFFH